MFHNAGKIYLFFINFLELSKQNYPSKVYISLLTEVYVAY